jgi:tryptophan-rich sensory protein
MYLLLLGCILLPLLVGAAGSGLSVPGIGSWYSLLNKPFFTPPSWVFAPVWTVLYLLMGISLWLFIREEQSPESRRKGILLWSAQLFFNAIWSVAFFAFQSPLAGLIIILILLVLIILTMRSFYPVSRPAAYLLIPYICWVCIATCLNGAIWLMN